MAMMAPTRAPSIDVVAPSTGNKMGKRIGELSKLISGDWEPGTWGAWEKYTHDDNPEFNLDIGDSCMSDDMPNDRPCAFGAVIRYLPGGNGRRYSVVQLATGEFAVVGFVGQDNVPTITRCGGESIAVDEERLLKFIGELRNGNTPKDRRNQMRKLSCRKGL